MDINELKNLLRQHNLKPNFTYGQNFLLDDIVLRDIVEAAEVVSTDKILEIGPGVGTLTELLCQRAGFVLSVEKDPKFQPILRAIKKTHRENFRYEIADALEFDYQKSLAEGLGFRGKGLAPTPSPLRPSPYKVVANIPYYITGKILQMLLGSRYKPSSITILTQKEVAQSIVAGAGGLSVLAISVQLYGEPELIRVVSKESFYPAPKVDSAILRVKLFDRPKYDIGDEKFFFKVLRACFAGKRKQIHNTLANNLGLNKDLVAKVLKKIKINPAARPQELAIGEWVELVRQIKM